MLLEITSPEEALVAAVVRAGKRVFGKYRQWTMHRVRTGRAGDRDVHLTDGWGGRRRGDAEFMRSREIQRKILNKFGISAPISYTSEIPSAQNIYKTKSKTTPTVFPSNEIAGHADTRRRR